MTSPYRTDARQSPTVVAHAVPFKWVGASAYAVLGALFVWFLAGETNNPKFVQFILGTAFYVVLFGFTTFPVVRFRARMEGREVVVEGSRFPHLTKTTVSSPLDDVDRFVAASANKHWFLVLVTTDKEGFPLSSDTWDVSAARFSRAESTLNRWLDAQRS